MGNVEQTLAALYLRYVNLDTNIQSNLREYDLLRRGALTALYTYEVQK